MTIHPQAGIFQEGSRYHHFLEYALPPAAPRSAVATAVQAGRGDGPAVVVAFGARLWREIAPRDMPESLRDFSVIEGADIGGAEPLLAPATQRDLLFWVQGEGRDAVLDRALALHRALGAVARLELDLAGFT